MFFIHVQDPAGISESVLCLMFSQQQQDSTGPSAGMMINLFGWESGCDEI